MLGGNAGAVRTFGQGGAHHGFALLAHDSAHVFKVDVHMAGHVDDFGNAAHGVFQHVVGIGEGFVLAYIVAQHFEKFLVEHHDQGVDVGLQLGQTGIGIFHARAAFELEGLGHHAHGQDAHLFGHLGDDGSGAGSGAAAHAGGDEEHVGAFQRNADVGFGLLGGQFALVGTAARAQAALAQLDAAVCAAAVECLGIGVGANELHPVDRGLDHVLNCVTSTAAHANDLDQGALVERFVFN